LAFNATNILSVIIQLLLQLPAVTSSTPSCSPGCNWPVPVCKEATVQHTADFRLTSKRAKFFPVQREGGVQGGLLLIFTLSL
uniref:Uncharacterized protein n=1 Tax=Apteryx owenii TaxID=8824 RepID=A0A8B9NY59_APTOW